MQRLKLLAGMLALCALCAAVLVFASPYAPVVAPVAEIEEIWAIEDARAESGAPLVTALENNGVPLAYDAQENTFYCTLGLDNGDEWPQMHLTAPGAKDVSLVFVDDYSYDWCQDAIRDGYSYEVMAYTGTEYAYFYIVFTGLPIVSMHAQAAEIGYEDVRADVAFSTPGEELTVSTLTHLRGAGSRISEKKSYKIDFVQGADGSGLLTDVPTLGQADDVILLAGVMDDSLMRDKLSWDIYAMIADGSESYGPRAVQYVELFVNDRYAGVYLMMEPVDDAEELRKRGSGAPGTDSVYRTAQLQYAGERPYVENSMREGSIYELYHAPAAGHEFDALHAYLALERLPEGEAYDAEFERMAMEYIDLESILRYYLFVQAGGMSDNVFNNMYVIANREEDGLRYRFAPWDMDLTWGRFTDEETGDAYQGLFSFDVAQRMIDVDAGGVTQTRLHAMWRQLRQTVFTQEKIQALVDEYTRQLEDSGAYVRNSLRWRGEAYGVDGYEIVSFAAEHFVRLDEIFAAYAP